MLVGGKGGEACHKHELATKYWKAHYKVLGEKLFELEAMLKT